MATRYFGEPIRRNEDPRLLTGQALFVDDVELPGMLHGAFLRSVYAHARLGRVDVSRALARPGVVAVYTAESLGDYWKPGPLLVSPPPIEGIEFHARADPHAQRAGRHAGPVGAPGAGDCPVHRLHHVPNYYSEFTAVFTNKTLVTPYRGAGSTASS